jgi:hypothetical protein
MNRSTFLRAGLALGAASLASCASLLGPRQVELPLHKLQAGIERAIRSEVPEIVGVEAVES